MKTRPVCSIDGCDRLNHGHGLCITHYSHWRKYGDPVSQKGAPLRWLIEAIKVETRDCIDWPWAKDSDGYGMVRADGKHRKTHHVVLELTGRAAPGPGQETRHLCGRPGCINPLHLRVGTPSENQRDRVAHGTSWRGENQPAHKLTAVDVLAIRASAEPAQVLAERYGVVPDYIRDLRSGRSRRWSWLR